MKVYLDPSTVFGGNNRNSSREDQALRLLEKTLKDAKRELKELKNKKPGDDKKKDEKKDDKMGVLDYFMLITGLSSIFMLIEAYIICTSFIHAMEVLHK